MMCKFAANCPISRTHCPSAYDFHGPWDLAVQGEDGTAKPHTSSKDIMDAIVLYTRAGVDFSKGKG